MKRTAAMAENTWTFFLLQVYYWPLCLHVINLLILILQLFQQLLIWSLQFLLSLPFFFPLLLLCSYCHPILLSSYSDSCYFALFPLCSFCHPHCHALIPTSTPLLSYSFLLLCSYFNSCSSDRNLTPLLIFPLLLISFYSHLYNCLYFYCCSSALIPTPAPLIVLPLIWSYSQSSSLDPIPTPAP